MPTFNPDRFVVARQRRRLKGGELAQKAGVGVNTISRLVKSKTEPDQDTISALAKALQYPIEFFYSDSLEVLSKDEVSFRSLTRMPSADRDAAIAAGSLGVLLSDWIDERFNLPKIDVPDLRHSDPEQAAMLLRQHWTLGEQPIPTMLKLMESKGIRVLSLCENTRMVDAFSFWRGERAFIFLNTFKTPEHSIFDSAHELGHLVLHRHSSLSASKQAEIEANRFASAFLMPMNDLVARIPRHLNADSIIKIKKRWKVSAMAISHRLHSVGKLTDWQYRAMCIELSKRGYRTAEPDGIERETSVVLQRVFEQLWSEKITKKEVAQELNIPLEELECLIFDLIGKRKSNKPSKIDTGLRVIE